MADVESRYKKPDNYVNRELSLMVKITLSN